MSNAIANWWRSYQFHTAIKKGNLRRAEELLQEIQKSGARLSSLEKLFKDKLQLEQTTRDYRQQISAQYRQLSQLRQQLEQIEPSQALGEISTDILTPEPEFIEFVSKNFKFVEHDENMLQCTGIHEHIFYDFESSLVEFLNIEFATIDRNKLLDELKIAREDIESFKRGEYPKYSCKLTPHLYFIRPFLSHVYSSYMAWFLVYNNNLLPKNINILDIAAGPGTVAYGLALLLQSISCFYLPEGMHVCYYSLEKQATFQYRGLQFWRRYIETQQTVTNAYFRFDTTDIFDRDAIINKIPQGFFDFITISHGLFEDKETRTKSHTIFKEIFANNLKTDGCVLLIVQNKKLFQLYNASISEDHDREGKLVRELLSEMGLKLVWYKYLTSTGKRMPQRSEFAKFARENLPLQRHMSALGRQYRGLNHDLHYTLDDYVILAKK